MGEEYEYWYPVKAPEESYIDVEIFRNNCGTKIQVFGETHKIIIHFEGVLIGLQISMETARMGTIGGYQKKLDNRAYFAKWPLYKVKNSNYSKWFIKESCGIYTEQELYHYCIISDDDIIDILTYYQPKVSSEPLPVTFWEKHNAGDDSSALK